MCRLLLVAISIMTTSCSRDSGTGPPNAASSAMVASQVAASARDVEGSVANELSANRLTADANPILASAAVSKSNLLPGEETGLTISVKILPGWHIYGLEGSGPNQPSRIALKLPKEITADEG